MKQLREIERHVEKMHVVADAFQDAVDKAEAFDEDLEDVHGVAEDATKFAGELGKEVEHLRALQTKYGELADALEEAMDKIAAAAKDLADFEDDDR